MQPYIIASSILSANWAFLGKEAKAVLSGGADWIHFDVMDNHYVPNLGFAPPLCKAFRNAGILAPIDVHLMTKPVDNLIYSFANIGATSISFHPEATKDINKTLRLIHNLGLNPGIAFSPETPISILSLIQFEISIIVVMSVNPGFGGQVFIKNTLKKIEQVRKWIEKNNSNIRLEVDGGISLDNIQDIANAGADTFVIGSSIFKTNNYKITLKKFRDKLNYLMP